MNAFEWIIVVVAIFFAVMFGIAWRLLHLKTVEFQWWKDNAFYWKKRAHRSEDRHHRATQRFAFIKNRSNDFIEDLKEGLKD